MGPFRLIIKTDTYGYETSWEFKKAGDTCTVVGPTEDEGGSYPSSTEFTRPENGVYYCLEAGVNYVFTLKDTYGDGIYDSGFVKLSLGGDDDFHLINDFDSNVMTYDFTIPTKIPSSMPSSSFFPSSSPTESPSSPPTTSPSSSPTASPSSSPSSSPNGTPSSSPIVPTSPSFVPTDSPPFES